MAEALDLDHLVARFKKDMEQGALEQIARKYLLDNPHKVNLVMSPDEKDNYHLTQEKNEKQALADIQNTLSEKDIETIKDTNQRLKKK